MHGRSGEPGGGRLVLARISPLAHFINHSLSYCPHSSAEVV